jgi:hypothetical protein
LIFGWPILATPICSGSYLFWQRRSRLLRG